MLATVRTYDDGCAIGGARSRRSRSTCLGEDHVESVRAIHEENAYAEYGHVDLMPHEGHQHRDDKQVHRMARLKAWTGLMRLLDPFLRKRDNKKDIQLEPVRTNDSTESMQSAWGAWAVQATEAMRAVRAARRYGLLGRQR